MGLLVAEIRHLSTMLDFSQTLHCSSTIGSMARPDAGGHAINCLSIYRHGKDGLPELSGTWIAVTAANAARRQTRCNRQRILQARLRRCLTGVPLLQSVFRKHCALLSGDVRASHRPPLLVAHRLCPSAAPRPAHTGMFIRTCPPAKFDHLS